MKKLVFLILLSFLFQGCTTLNETRDNGDLPSYLSFWHLRNVSGGTSGILAEYNLDTIVWHFDVENGEIIVKNESTEDGKPDGYLETGNYVYSIEFQSNKQFLVVNGEEYGNIYLEGDNIMVVNGNDKIYGTGTDEYIYTFTRTVVAE